MPQSELDQLLDQLDENQNDPRARKAIVRKMAGLEDPRAIVELAALYRKDIDPGVKRAAASALRVYREIEQRLNSGDGAKKSALSPSMLVRVRSALVGLLVLTLVGNGLLFGIRLIPPPPKAPQLVASKRDDLTASLKTRIENARTNGTYLRQRWQEIQGNLTPTCPGQFVDVSKADVAPIDLKTYPDLPDLNDQINTATEQVIAQRTDWEGICANPTDKGVIARYAGEGGAPGRIVEIDKTLKVLEQAQLKFNAWVNNPAPTYFPSATPITPTAIPPTSTMTPTTGPSATPTIVPTVSTATPTLPQSYTFDGLRLDTLDSYTYKLVVNYAGSATGTLVIQTTRTAKPLTAKSTAQYDVNLTETERLIAPLNQTFFTKGKVRYVLAGGGYYTDSGTTACKSLKATDILAANLDTLNPSIFFKFTGKSFTLVKNETINGVLTQHFHADSKTGEGKAAVTTTYEVYVTVDKQIPVRINLTVAGAYPGLAAPSKGSLTSFSAVYDLTAFNPDVGTIKAPPSCPKP